METDVVVKCEIKSEIDIDHIKGMLPDFKTIITHVGYTDEELPKLHVKLLIAAQTSDEALGWVTMFEDKTKTRYSIRSTTKCHGRYVTFKQRRNCYHKASQKHASCPSQLTITLRAVKERHRHKSSSDAPDPDFPCLIDIVMTHNHDSFKCRRVDDEVRTKLVELYHNGHSAASARETLKMQIQLENEDYESILTDRKYYPDYLYCYHIYKQIFTGHYGPFEFNEDVKEFLKNKVKDFNTENGEVSANVWFENTDYIICICPPLIKKVHQKVKSSSEVVFMDSIRTIDREGRLFILSTPSACGALPLGVIITSSETVPIITKGLIILQDLIGSGIFYGNTQGPQVFLTNESGAEIPALQSVWLQSTILFSTFYVLEAAWKCIIKRQNEIPLEKQVLFFRQFKEIVYAQTPEESYHKYITARDSASNSHNYWKFLANYWARKELWVLCFRGMPSNVNDANNCSGATLRLLDRKLFHRTKAFNVVQMVDFLMTKFIDFHKVRLLDAANNRLNRSILSKPLKAPPEGLLEKIKTLSGNIALVPDDTQEELFYIVNVDVLICGCFQGNIAAFCKHVDWACAVIHSNTDLFAIDDAEVQEIFYKIATSNDFSHMLFPQDVKYEEVVEAEQKCGTSIDPESVTHKTKGMYEEDLILNGLTAIDKIEQSLKEFLMKSPRTASAALQNLSSALDGFKNTSAMASACFTIEKELQRKKELSGKRKSSPSQCSGTGEIPRKQSSYSPVNRSPVYVKEEDS